MKPQGRRANPHLPCGAHYFPKQDKWNSVGEHAVSLCVFRSIVPTDSCKRQTLTNRIKSEINLVSMCPLKCLDEIFGDCQDVLVMGLRSFLALVAIREPFLKLDQTFSIANLLVVP
jgi:hypothetical protein